MSGFEDVAIAIPTMPQRKAMALRLVSELRRECAGAAIYAHEHVDSRRDFPETMEMGLSAGREWVLSLEDDALLCPKFGARMSGAIEEMELCDYDAALFFSRSRKDIETMRRGFRWRSIPVRSLSSTVCFAVRSRLLEGIGEWAAGWYRRHPDQVHASDYVLRDLLTERGAKVAVHAPSLVQHAGVKTTLPRRGGSRQSESFRLAFGEAS